MTQAQADESATVTLLPQHDLEAQSDSKDGLSDVNKKAPTPTAAPAKILFLDGTSTSGRRLFRLVLVSIDDVLHEEESQDAGPRRQLPQRKRPQHDVAAVEVKRQHLGQIVLLWSIDEVIPTLGVVRQHPQHRRHQSEQRVDAEEALGKVVGRWDHMTLSPHAPTFVAGSMAAVMVVKLDTWIKGNERAAKTS
ncbi:hypothetical protein ON010_g2603 [Phytophthora cinnamomi]|nr:hypothetical protein ON010_g2603 [Phytophthora cinnamomi]